MMLHRLYTVVVALALMTGGAHADTLPVPKVDYSADRIMDMQGMQFNAKVYASQGRERNEMDMHGMKMITIVRPDKKLVWTLMPMQKMYQEISMDQAQPSQTGGVPEDVKVSKVGKATVEGSQTTQYKMVLKDNSAEGLVWVTDEGIPVKMEMQGKDSEQPFRMTMSLKNIKLGKQDAALFEIPAGYTKMPAFGGMEQGMPGMGPGMMPKHP